MNKIIERGCDAVSLADYPYNCFVVVLDQDSYFFKLIKNARLYAKQMRGDQRRDVVIEPRYQLRVATSDHLAAESLGGFKVCPLTRKQDSKAWKQAVKEARRDGVNWRPLAVHIDGGVIVQLSDSGKFEVRNYDYRGIR